jgi:hypothetical protein
MIWNDGTKYEGGWKEGTFVFSYNDKELTITTETGYITTITDKD